VTCPVAASLNYVQQCPSCQSQILIKQKLPAYVPASVTCRLHTALLPLQGNHIAACVNEGFMLAGGVALCDPKG
jgi:hypothetical protein